jgi:Holliday junction resolvase RusA-like endonuclease
VHLADDHVEAERRITAYAVGAWGGRPPLTGPVGVEVTTWHPRPLAARRKRDRCASPSLFVGKPDADNVAKLVLDALTRAGVWRDDTQVAGLVVWRWRLPLDERSEHVGQERTEVRVSVLE